MYEYNIEVSGESIVIYHTDRIEKKDLLLYIDSKLNELDDLSGEELVYDLLYKLKDYGFLIQNWLEYEWSICLDFSDKRELRRDIREKMYGIE